MQINNGYNQQCVTINNGCGSILPWEIRSDLTWCDGVTMSRSHTTSQEPTGTREEITTWSTSSCMDTLMKQFPLPIAHLRVLLSETVFKRSATMPNIYYLISTWLELCRSIYLGLQMSFLRSTTVQYNNTVKPWIVLTCTIYQMFSPLTKDLHL